ncbi:hypothetical protein ABW19_dt0208693 [Dactylella cylindrospora]|nr:hypothetical protein ABW19_dt0208693 [Dactylella cylindrospora]
MHFSTVAIAALAAFPSLISAFSLTDISYDIGDVNSKCASQFDIPLMSCGRLPGTCSEACKEQLRSLEKTLKNVCDDDAEDAQSLLLVALNGDLVDTLCTGSSGGSNSNPSTVAAQTTPTTFASGPGKTAEPSGANAELSFSGVIQASSAVEGLNPSATGLVIDTSAPDTGATQTVAFPEATSYAPSTFRTSSAPSSTQTSSGDSSNGSLFTSQEDLGNGAGALRAGFLGLAVGIIALIVNLA